MTEELTADDVKDLGNKAVKNNQFAEAILHYSQAIKMQPDNPIFYSNRSFAFLKMQHYYNALQDAKETIRLNPAGAKGYFRKGEVEYATEHFTDAILSYEQALQFQPNDDLIISCIHKARRQYHHDSKVNEQIPWLSSGIGIVVGVTLIILDYVYTVKPTHPLVMALVTIIISIVGYAVGKGYRHYVISQRNVLLQPPEDLFDMDSEEMKEENKTKSKQKFTKSQARQRYKKGKL